MTVRFFSMTNTKNASIFDFKGGIKNKKHLALLNDMSIDCEVLKIAIPYHHL